MPTKALENIDNPRLMRLVQKTLSWRFLIIHIPGKLLAGPDTMSRIPVNTGLKSGGAWVRVADLTPAPDLGPSSLETLSLFRTKRVIIKSTGTREDVSSR